MGTSGRAAWTDAGVDGGARADHNLVRSGDESSGGMMGFFLLLPLRLLRPLIPLVAACGERVQRR